MQAESRPRLGSKRLCGRRSSRNAKQQLASRCTQSRRRPMHLDSSSLTVAFKRTRQGQLALAGYPAFVGAPALGFAQLAEGTRSVSDPGLRTVAERALRNYLADAPAELAADLTGTARVSLPTTGMTLATVQRIAWTADSRSVIAVVQAVDARGAQYTLAYELDVVETQGRWEISAVQMDPYS